MTTSPPNPTPVRLRLPSRAELLRVVAATVLAAVIAGLYLLLAPNWYTSTLTVVPAGQPKPTLPLAGALGALGSAADLPGLDFGQAVDVERIAAVLKSTSVTDAVIARFNLIDSVVASCRSVSARR